MFWQQRELPDPEGKKIWCWQIMILLFNMVMTKAPECYKVKDEIYQFPIYLILSWPMETKAGFSAFLNEKVRNNAWL